MKHIIIPLFVGLLVGSTTSFGRQSSASQVSPQDGGSQQRLGHGDTEARVGRVAGAEVTANKQSDNQTNNQKAGSAVRDEITSPSDGAVANYVLGPGDRVSLLIKDLDEFTDQTFSVDMHGDINLPLAGRFHVTGMTLNQFEQETRDRLKKYVKDPDVVANITEFHSQSISVLGAVDMPGVHQVQGHKTLFEVISISGGLRSDAGNNIYLTRNLRWGRIPLPTAKDDPTGQFSIATVKVKATMDAADPAENIAIMPGDVISVPKAQVVYAVGSVMRPGGFLLGEHDTLSSLQVLSLAEGLDKVASASKARILRAVPGTPNRTEIAINLKELLDGKASDVPLQADDILFVPSSKTKTITKRSLEAAITIASGIAIYGRY